ncbi:MAG: class I SAM-dependent methyltransferase [Bryobacterales bacterium]|nr:class I SAM-dependent methyltransferase [Bryobacterales bacterium]
MNETALYRTRFDKTELRAQSVFWVPICRYLERYIPPDGTTLDLGAGFCHFINNVTSARKIALDLNEENLRNFAAGNVQIMVSDGSHISLPDESLDTVFASNVYEHFPSREAVAESFAEVYRLLKPGGRLIVMQPNFAHCTKHYYDFFDHRLAFTHLGMAEGLRSAGFEVPVVHGRFLPYTSKSALPRAPWMVALYLRFPMAWLLLGQQMLLVAKKVSGSPFTAATA